MKKAIAVAVALSAVMCVGLAGCDKGQETEQQQPEEVLLYDFEDYDRNFQLMRVMNSFGAVDVNRDAQYVRSGETSAHLRPLGPNSTMITNSFQRLKSESCLYIPFSSATYEFDYTDLTKIEEISFAMYNAEETDLSLYLGFIFEKNAVEVSSLTKFTLTPGWNDVFFLLDHNVLALDNDLSSCFGLAMTFDRVGSRELKDAPDLYLDDISLHTTAEPVQPENIIELDEGEICDFEKSYQKYMIGLQVHDKIRNPDVAIVEAADYGLEAPSGNKILRVATKPSSVIDGTIYNGIYLKQSLLEAVGLTEASPSARLVFWIRSEAEVGLDMTVVAVHALQSSVFNVAHIYPSPGGWLKVSIPLSYIDDHWGEGEESFSANPGQIRIVWGEFTGDEDRVLYFDHFHIEQ